MALNPSNSNNFEQLAFEGVNGDRIHVSSSVGLSIDGLICCFRSRKCQPYFNTSMIANAAGEAEWSLISSGGSATLVVTHD